MSIQEEIERKYLIYEDGHWYIDKNVSNMIGIEYLVYKVYVAGSEIKQGYIMAENLIEERVREIVPPSGTVLRVWTRKTGSGLIRTEEERDLTKREFDTMWEETRGRRLYKRRLNLHIPNIATGILKKEMCFDLYMDRRLMVAEVEFYHEKDANVFPDLGKDVTDDSNYKNKNLAR